jgi:hypothetical protein
MRVAVSLFNLYCKKTAVKFLAGIAALLHCIGVSSSSQHDCWSNLCISGSFVLQLVYGNSK